MFVLILSMDYLSWTGSSSIYAYRSVWDLGRPTEIMERDIYLCQSRYDEGDGTIRKMKVIKVVQHSVGENLVFVAVADL